MRAADKLFREEITVFNTKVKAFDVLFLLVISILALFVRVSTYNVVSSDYANDFAEWMKECHAAGGFAYLGISPGKNTGSSFSYNCAFQYIIVILHYIGAGIKDIYLVKSVSVVFDFVCAVTVFRIVYQLTNSNINKAVISYAATLLLPTVFLNSAAWGQNDSIYSSFILLSFLHCLKKGRDQRVFVYLGIAYCFKQQAIFFLPFIILMWFKNRIKIRYIFWLPVVYFLSMIPAAIAGRNIGELLGVYGDQVALFFEPTMNAPSIYTILSRDLLAEDKMYIVLAGIIVTIMIFGILAYYSYIKSFKITSEYMLILLIFTLEICFFCLPVMHERYAFIAEILTIVYGLINYKRIPVCIVLQVISLVTYSTYLFGSQVDKLWPLSMVLLAIIFVIGYDLYKHMKITSSDTAAEDDGKSKASIKVGKSN